MRTHLLFTTAHLLLCLNATAQVFTQMQDLPEPRYRAFSFAADGKLYTGAAVMTAM